jgi:hypothetical protein
MGRACSSRKNKALLCYSESTLIRGKGYCGLTIEKIPGYKEAQDDHYYNNG